MREQAAIGGHRQGAGKRRLVLSLYLIITTLFPVIVGIGQEQSLPQSRQLVEAREAAKKSAVRVFCLAGAKEHKATGFVILNPKSGRKCIVTARHICPLALEHAYFDIQLGDNSRRADLTPVACLEDRDILILGFQSDEAIADCPSIPVPESSVHLPKPGDLVYAIGSADGYPIAVHKSEVLDCLKATEFSRNARNFLGPDTDLIRHSIGTSPGFSGGPLIDGESRLVGIHHGALSRSAFDHIAVSASYIADPEKWPALNIASRPRSFEFSRVDRYSAATVTDQRLDRERSIGCLRIPKEDNRLFLSQLAAHLESRFAEVTPIVKQTAEVAGLQFAFVRYDHLGCSFIAPDAESIKVRVSDNQTTERVVFILPHINIEAFSTVGFKQNADQEFLKTHPATNVDDSKEGNRYLLREENAAFTRQFVLAACKDIAVRALGREARRQGAKEVTLQVESREPRVDDEIYWLEAVYLDREQGLGYGIKVGVCGDVAVTLLWQFSVADYEHYVAGDRCREEFIQEMALYCSLRLY